MSSVNVIPDIYKVDSYVNVNDYSSNDYQYKEIHEKSTANVSSLKKGESFKMMTKTGTVAFSAPEIFL